MEVSAPQSGGRSRVMEAGAVSLSSENEVTQDLAAPNAERREHPLRRRTSDLKQAARRILGGRSWSLSERIELCDDLIAERPIENAALAAFFEELGTEERHYWISSLYTLLMPPRRRKRLAAFFTPPHLCGHVIDRLVDNGLDLTRHEVLDPAAGGAAFLVPLTLRIRDAMRSAGRPPAEIVEAVEARLAGNDIEPGLTSLSQALIAQALAGELATLGRPLRPVVQRANSLRGRPERPFDAVLSNPPYGRVFRPSAPLLERWRSVITDGHVNTYALFIAMALERVRPGGLVGLVIPTSFTAGPYFAALREHVRRTADVLSIDLIGRREDVFVDVIQDACVLALRRRPSRPRRGRIPVATVDVEGEATHLGSLQLPRQVDRHWALPSRDVGGHALRDFFDPRLTALADYGFIARTGYFVWNRSRERLRTGTAALPGEVPLLWAHCIRGGGLLDARSGPRYAEVDGALSYVTVDPSSSALIRGPSIVFQRTTNRNQARRLVGALVPESFIAAHPQGYVTENHTIVVLPDPAKRQLVSPDDLCTLLTSATVDGCFRQISGTVSVSTKLLRSLPLPHPTALTHFLLTCDDPEIAIRAAFRQTLKGSGLESPATSSHHDAPCAEAFSFETGRQR